MRIRLLDFFVGCGFFLLPALVLAQAGSYWPDRDLQGNLDRVIMGDGQRDHLSVRPYAVRDIRSAVNSLSDSALVFPNNGNGFWAAPGEKEWLFDFTPLLIAEGGYSSRRKGVFTTAPGLALNLRHGDKWSFYADVFGGGTRLPEYQESFLDTTGVLPSQGRDRANAGNPALLIPTARLNYAPTEHFQFELGYGRNFLGQGFRSLFLSDVAFNYPYLKIETDVWNFKYINIYSALQGSKPAENQNPTQFQAKYSTTHYLSWAVSPRFNIGLFETIIWQGRDTLSDRGFDPNYLNPIIFFRPVEYSVGSPDNALLGFDLSFKASKQILIYGQLLFDEFLLSEFRDRTGWWGNKWGGQIGVKTFDIFVAGLRLQVEFNTARPFTYTHGSVLQNFGHYNQPLAHQLGTNFYEGLVAAYFERGDYFGKATLVYADFGRDPDSLNFGGDIYKSYINPSQQYGNTIGQGVGHSLYFQQVEGGVILNRALNLRASLIYTFRHERIEKAADRSEHIFGIRLATNLYNKNDAF